MIYDIFKKKTAILTGVCSVFFYLFFIKYLFISLELRKHLNLRV